MKCCLLFLFQKNTKSSLVFFILYIYLLFNTPIFSQPLTQLYPEFIVDDRSLPDATAGGLSAPQYSEVDLNRDGIQDLFVFDKMGQIGLTFINSGTPSTIDYTYDPSYLNNFPDLNEWVLLRDYNGDGIQDIFAYSSVPGVPGVEVYTGYYDDQDKIAFRRFQFTDGEHNIIYHPTGRGVSNLFISNIDYPAVDDIDGDGDLDIVTFNLGGGIVELYANQSVERGFGLDSLEFILMDDCWGRFFESGITVEIDLSTSQDECAAGFRSSEPRSGNLHAGSTLLTLDMDNDGDKEVILGDLSFNNLNLLSNGGDNNLAFMTEQEVDFPNNSVSVDIPLFPASFYLDINNDGLKDLIAAPNLGNDIGETYEVGWYYENTGTSENPVFEYRFNDLLVSDMLDLGTSAYPVFVDYNVDGLQDLVVGNKGFFVPGGNKSASLFLFENIGTATKPVFELIDDDYLNMNQFSNSATQFAPTFGDLDSDGDLDILVGEGFGNLFYAENLAGPNQPFDFAPIRFGYQNIDPGQVSTPQIIDLNKDGLPDLVIGERNGNINYYENIGTPTEPLFGEDPTNSKLGDVDVREIGFVTGHSAPQLLTIDGETQLFSGTETGAIRRYTNIDDNIAGVFTEIDRTYGQVQTGAENALSFADINNDGFLEMVVGNIRGGLQFFATDLMMNPTATSTTAINNLSDIQLYPNPVSNHLFLQLPSNQEIIQLSIHNALGQQLQTIPSSQLIEINDLKMGIYFLNITLKGGQTVTKKFLKIEEDN